MSHAIECSVHTANTILLAKCLIVKNPIFTKLNVDSYSQKLCQIELKMYHGAVDGYTLLLV